MAAARNSQKEVEASISAKGKNINVTRTPVSVMWAIALSHLSLLLLIECQQDQNLR